MSIFIGSGTAVCTPFSQTGAFNPDAYEKLIDFQIRNNTDAIVSCGTTGEISTLSPEEHVDVVAAAKVFTTAANAKYKKSVPVIAGAGGNDTAGCIKKGKALIQAGADALMYTTPYYNKTSQKGLVAHFTAIANAVDAPIVLYNIPGRTGMNMSAITLAELAKVPNIVAIKEASGDFGLVAEMAERAGDAVDIYSGNDDYIVPVLSLGGKGVITTIGNIAPQTVHDMVDLYLKGDVVSSRKLQLSILPMVRHIFADVNPIPIKAALNVMGFDMGDCRLPLIACDDALIEKMKTQMHIMGILS